MPRLRRSPAARVINVTSGGMYLAHLHLDDLQFEQRPYDGVRAYAESKRAEVIMTAMWAKAWADTDIRVHCVHPGWAATPGVNGSLPGFSRLLRPLLRSSEQGADGIVWLCVTPDLDTVKNGQLWFDRQIRSPHKRGVKRNNSAEIEQFWQMLQALTASDDVDFDLRE